MIDSGTEIPSSSLSAALSGTHLPASSSAAHGLAGSSPLVDLPNATSVDAALSSTAILSIVPILTSQRDRYRQRNNELEEVPFFFF